MVTLSANRTIYSEYAKWFDVKLTDFANTHRRPYQSPKSFLRQNGKFITISFDHKCSKDWSELDRFNHVYNDVCKNLFGRNFHRKHHDDQRPLAIACVDANGSRYWKTIGEIENLHIHSIWVTTPQTAEQFKKFWNDDAQLEAMKKRLSIRAIDVRPLDLGYRNSTGQSQISSYTAKFVAMNSADAKIGDDLRIYPRHN